MKMSPLEAPVSGYHQQPTATVPQTEQTPTITAPPLIDPQYQTLPYTMLRSQAHLNPPALNNATHPAQYQQTTTGAFAPRGTAIVPTCIMGQRVTFINGHMRLQEYEYMQLQARARVDEWVEGCRRSECPGFGVVETPVGIQR